LRDGLPKREAFVNGGEVFRQNARALVKETSSSTKQSYARFV
jgi:hypothetical protein